MKIIPVNFKSEDKAMLGHCKMILERNDGRMVIYPDRFDKLITASRIAVDNDSVLDKEAVQICKDHLLQDTNDSKDGILEITYTIVR